MIRLKFFIDFSKEEKWLAEMARQGWELCKVGFGYEFRAVEPQEAVIRIDYRMFASQDSFTNYCTLFEDSGWRHIAGSRNSGVQYFKRLPAGSAGSVPSEDIFSDELSRAERYKRIARIWLGVSGAILVILVGMGISGAADLRALIQPARFYLTPGLWERSGADFWQAFWFETPFALFRAGLLYSYPISLVCFLILIVKSHRLYHKEKNNVYGA